MIEDVQRESKSANGSVHRSLIPVEEREEGGDGRRGWRSFGRRMGWGRVEPKGREGKEGGGSARVGRLLPLPSREHVFEATVELTTDAGLSSSAIAAYQLQTRRSFRTVTRSDTPPGEELTRPRSLSSS